MVLLDTKLKIDERNGEKIDDDASSDISLASSTHSNVPGVSGFGAYTHGTTRTQSETASTRGKGVRQRAAKSEGGRIRVGSPDEEQALVEYLKGGGANMFATAVRFLAKKGKGKRVKSGNVNIGEEGQQWSGTLRQIVKEKGPLTVASFWEHAQSTGIRSKRHMKIVLKWMRGQNHVKLVCNHLGDRRSPTEKEFMYTYIESRSERLAKDEASTPTDGNSNPSIADDSPFADVPPHLEGHTRQKSEPNATVLDKVGLKELL